VNCAICGIRKPKRHCPGVRADICSICCGTGREETIDCPLDCEYLREAHRHEAGPEIDPATIPNQDVKVDEAFLSRHEWLLMLLGSAVVDGAVKVTSATDFDAREALEALVKTYRTLESGLIYETRSTNPFAAAIQESVQARVEDIRRRAAEAGGQVGLSDGTVLGMLVFLQRLEYAHNNGRKRSKAFLEFLNQFRVPSLPLGSESLVEPTEPRVIL